MKRIDQHSAEGKALQATVKKKLADYLGEGYNDEVQPSVIMCAPMHAVIGVASVCPFQSISNDTCGAAGAAAVRGRHDGARYHRAGGGREPGGLSGRTCCGLHYMVRMLLHMTRHAQSSAERHPTHGHASSVRRVGSTRQSLLSPSN